MATEQRVISAKGGISARPAPSSADTSASAPAAARARKPKKKLLLIVVAVVVLLGGGAGYWFLMGPGSGSGTEVPVAEPEIAPEPGEVFVIEAVSLNLAGGHYLRLGLGLQLTTEVVEEPDAAKALDLAIGLFSGRSLEEAQSAEGREALRAELAVLLEEAYHGDVMGVYFTDYVTQ